MPLDVRKTLRMGETMVVTVETEEMAVTEEETTALSFLRECISV